MQQRDKSLDFGNKELSMLEMGNRKIRSFVIGNREIRSECYRLATERSGH